MSCITEAAQGFPGWSGRTPPECATIGQVLQESGWSTFWLGKDHNVPEQDISSGANRSEWPLQKGFDRYYGFIGGETNQWYPDLIEDNKFIDQPYLPEDGYHLSKDLVDQAMQMIRTRRRATRPSRGSCGFAPVRTTRRIMRPRTTSRSTRASSTTVTTRTVNGSFRA
jgi:arylsulfatase